MEMNVCDRDQRLFSVEFKIDMHFDDLCHSSSHITCIDFSEHDTFI